MSFFLLLFITFIQAEEPCSTTQNNLTQGLMSPLDSDQVWPGLSQILANKMMPTCKTLEIGEYEDINIDEMDSLTTVEHKYRLKRLSEKHYEVSFNLSFYEKKKGKQSDSLFNEKWGKRVNECLKEIEGKTWGSNGERVSFKLHGLIEEKKSSPKVWIKISSIKRSHSHRWNEKIECSTLVHELFHLAGLVDEYTEKKIGIIKDVDFGEIHHDHDKEIENPAYNCRKIYEQHSIMANDREAWNRIMDGWWLRLGSCRCNDQKSCSVHSARIKQLSQSFMRQPVSEYKDLKIEYPSQCSTGFSESQEYKEIPVSQEAKKAMDEKTSIGFSTSTLPSGFDFKKDELIFRFLPRPASQSNLLEPRHFNAIIYPGCVEKNHEYYQNSQNAYRTSVDHGGLGCVNMSWVVTE